ncbi:MAG: glycerol-3-phosphate 1-O-acyltransferase [Proteobacteria bacterium]|nr:glycerol-3-phosphate 1-O-acyltransferase [Pseudomonadota bacterium]
MTYLLVILGAYLVGSFPTGVFISKRKYGLDVREMGSGNIGATNVRRIFGWYAGILVFLIDLGKGAAPLWAIRGFYPDLPWLVCLTGISLVLGHCFSVFLGFKGGKGVATSLGCILVADPMCALIGGLVYLVFLKVSRISAVGSLAGVLSCIIFLVFEWPGNAMGIMVLTLCVIIVFRHQENLTRLKKTFLHKAP